jgi:hypothetical protein
VFLVSVRLRNNEPVSSADRDGKKLLVFSHPALHRRAQRTRPRFVYKLGSLHSKMLTQSRAVFSCNVHIVWKNIEYNIQNQDASNDNRGEPKTYPLSRS